MANTRNTHVSLLIRAAIHSLAASWPPAFALWVLSLVKVYTACCFLCKLNKSWLFIRSDYGTWLSSAIKLKVKPAVAEIELHWVSNVKSKGSLTVIKCHSTAFSSRSTVLKPYFTSWMVGRFSSQPTIVSFFSQRRPLLEALTRVWKMGWNSEMLLCTKVLTEHGAPEDLLCMCVYMRAARSEAKSVCRHGSLRQCTGMCSVTGAGVRWEEDDFNMCPGTWNACLWVYCWGSLSASHSCYYQRKGPKQLFLH